MCGRAQAVEQAGGGEDKGTDTDGRDAGPARRGRPQGLDHVVRNGLGDVGASGQDDRVRLGEDIEAVPHLDREGTGVGRWPRAADPDPVRRVPAGQPSAAEHLDRGGQVEGDDPGQGEHGDRMHG